MKTQELTGISRYPQWVPPKISSTISPPFDAALDKLRSTNFRLSPEIRQDPVFKRVPGIEVLILDDVAETTATLQKLQTRITRIGRDYADSGALFELAEAVRADRPIESFDTITAMQSRAFDTCSLPW